MTDLAIDVVAIRRVDDMLALGFAWAYIDIHLKPDATTAHPSIEIEVPLVYGEGDSIGAIRAKAYDRALAILRTAVDHLAANPPPPVEKPPRAPVAF